MKNTIVLILLLAFIIANNSTLGQDQCFHPLVKVSAGAYGSPVSNSKVAYLRDFNLGLAMPVRKEYKW